MNPEDMFRRMHDESRWKVTPLALRTPSAPRPAIVRRFVLPVVVIAAVAALFIGGVQTIRANAPAAPPQPTIEPTNSHTPAPSQSPTPAPTETPIAQVAPSGPWTSPPKQAFGGQCSGLMSDAEVRKVIGKGTIVTSAQDNITNNGSDFTSVWPLFADVKHNGGLYCGWRNATMSRHGEGPTLWVAALPAQLAPKVRANTSCVEMDGGCHLTIGANGYLFDVFLSDPQDGDALRANQLLTAKGNAAGAPPAIWSQRAGDWPADVDCKTLGDRALGAVANGSWGSSVRNARDMSEVGLNLAEGHGARGCIYGDSFGVSYLAGGAWLQPAIEAMYPNSKSIEITGADRTYKFTQQLDGTATLIFAISGENLLMLSPNGDSDKFTAAYAGSLIKALNSYKSGTTATPTATSAAPGSYLTSEGLGDLRIGKPIPDDNGYVTWKASNCEAGAWAPKASTIYEDGPERINKFGFLALPNPKNSHKAPLARILVSDASIPTKSGIRVGATLADLKRTYGKFDVEYTQPQTGAHLYEIKGAAGSVVFQLGGANYGYTAPPDTVSIIAVVPAGESLKDSAARMVQAPCDD